MTRKKALTKLREACQKVKEENGTIFTHGLCLDYWIQKHLEKCERMGVTRIEIITILSEFYKK